MNPSRGNLYEQIADRYRTAILDGTYPPGSLLPSGREIMAEWDVSRATHRQAMDTLVNEGLVEGLQGIGFRVRTDRRMVHVAADRYAASRAQGKALSLVDTAGAGELTMIILADGTGFTRFPETAHRWASQIEAGATVLARERVLYLDNEPVRHSVSWFPMLIAGHPDAAPLGQPAPLLPAGLAAFVTKLGFPYVRAVDDSWARMPTPAETDMLDLRRGVPVTELWHVAYTTQDRVVEVVREVFPGDRTVFHQELDLTPTG